MLVNVKQAADRLGVQPRTLMRWRKERRGPRFKRIVGCIRYSTEDLDEFIESATEATR